MPAMKRKRGDRSYSQDSTNNGSRPSPHRPENAPLAHQTRDQEAARNRGASRRHGHGRGGRGNNGYNGPRNDERNLRSPTNAPASTFNPSKSSPTVTTAMSPPPLHQRPLHASHPQKTPPSPTLVVPPAILPEAALPEPEESQQLSLLINWEYVTDDRITSWAASGRAEVVEIGTQARLDEDPMALGSIFQELLSSGLSKRLDPKVAGTTLGEILGEATKPVADTSLEPSMQFELTFDPHSLLLDSLSILVENDASNAHLRTIIASSGIPPDMIRQQLDISLLESLGLIRNTFARMGIRKQTNLLYRQSNYNLLREETEGYSKLITELFTTSNTEPSTSEVVEETFERVRALIGAFDLDVGRVLDVSLDVFAAVLVKQYRFFIKFLRASSWWPKDTAGDATGVGGETISTLPKWALPGSAGWSLSDDEKLALTKAKEQRDLQFWDRARAIGVKAFFEIGARSASHSDSTGQVSIDEPQEIEDRRWIEETGCFPPQGSHVAAQLLGFKLRFYASTARDASDVLPLNLIYLAALLIKIGFISLRDLYPHLWPGDELMEGVREVKMKEKAEREKLNRPGGGAKNALMMAGALADDTLPPPPRIRETDTSKVIPSLTPEIVVDKVSEEKDKLPEPADQKVQLLKSLLSIGAIPESLYILGRFPWLTEAYPELPGYIHRILHHSLSRLAEPLRPLAGCDGIRKPKKIALADQSGVLKGKLRFTQAPARRALRWAQLDKDDPSEATDFRFYWDNWHDNVPICQTVDDVFTLCSTLLNYSGVKIGLDSSLITKLARIGHKSLSDDASSTNSARWVDLCKRLLVPALSLTKSQPGVVNEVWELLKYFPTHTRYSIYAEWYSGSISRLPEIKAAFELSRAETRDVLKRISKTTLKLMARQLAKVAYTSPGVVFSVAIGQIESYDNLVEVVVDCARYFTYLGYDVLNWSLMSSLGGRGRNRVQADGMLTSKWLTALSLFAGKIFKRYSHMSPAPVLQYVLEQLRKGNTTDLVLLKEITTSMAGIVADTNFNEAQTLAMAGGELLRECTLLQLLDKRHDSQYRSSSKRLMRSLTEPKLAGQLLIAIAQERQTCTFSLPEPDSHLKLLGNLFDETQAVLAQYLDLLRSNLSVEEFDSLVPSVSDLISEFGIDANVAFWISRPSIAYRMAKDDKARNERRRLEIATTEQNGDITMTEADAPLSTPLEVNSPLPPQTNSQPSDSTNPESKANVTASNTPSNNLQESGSIESAPWHPVLKNLMVSIRNTMPEETWSHLSLSFYLTFWQLSLYDLMVPGKSYEAEVDRLKKRWIAAKDDRSDMSIPGLQRREAEKKSLEERQTLLNSEMKQHIQAYSHTKLRLRKEKIHWFDGFADKANVLNDALIQYCIFPRVTLSPNDSHFTFKIIQYLHASGTPNFSSKGLLDQIFRENRLKSLVFICTSQEAENLGRFIQDLLKYLSKWHANKAFYEAEAFGSKRDLPGFATSEKAENDATIHMEFEDFRRLLYKWHKNINAALKDCLTGGEYMHIRNAIIILKAIHLYFPVVNWNGRDQLGSVTELIKNEKREDLKIAATSLLGNLKRREKFWVLPNAFNLSNTEKIDSTSNPGRAISAKSVTPQPESGGVKSLNAAASLFKPNVAIETKINGKLETRVPSKRAAEDGGVEDARTNASLARPHDPKLTATSTQPSADNKSKLTISQDPALNNEQSKIPTMLTELQNGRPASRAPTPTPVSLPQDQEQKHISTSNVLPRSELSRPLPINPVASRMHHSLPNRPDLQVHRPPERRLPERSADRRDARDLRFEHGRLDRPSDIANSQDRRAPSPNRRMPERTPDWDRRDQPAWGGERDRPIRGSTENRSDRSSVRENWSDSRGADWALREKQNSEIVNGGRQDGQARDSAMPPPRSSVLNQNNDRTGASQAPPHSDRPSMNIDRRTETLRSERDDRDDRSSRNHSPRRSEDWRSSSANNRPESRRDERPPIPERNIIELSNGGRGRIEESHPPTGPRAGRPSSSDMPVSTSYERSRETFTPLPPVPRPIDPDHGRLNPPESRSAIRQQQQQDPNYGRLNPSAEIPSGPRRSVSGRGGRTASLPQSQVSSRHLEHNGQVSNTSSASQDRQPPTGPAPRITTRVPNVQLDRAVIPTGQSSAPATPVTDSSKDLVGVHPDRMRAIDSSSTYPENSSRGNNAATIADHKSSSVSGGAFDRSGEFQRQVDNTSYGAPSATTPKASNSASNPAPHAPGPPSGPRGSYQSPPSPVAPSPISRNPPPAGNFTGERRGDKRFASIQNVLQQAPTPPAVERGERGAAIRGRGSRQNSGYSIPSPTVITSQSSFSTSAQEEPRPDLFIGRTRTFQPSQESMMQSERNTSHPGRTRDSENTDRRSERHRPSGEHSRDRETSKRLEDHAPRRDEHRDRRGSGRDDREPPRRSREEGKERDRRDLREPHNPRDEPDRRENEDVGRNWNNDKRSSGDRGGDRGDHRGGDPGGERGERGGEHRGGNGDRGGDRRDDRESRRDLAARKRGRVDEMVQDRGHDKRMRRGA
ncbi:MAG: THO complex subunit 2 [Trizodia sp. TS-e1964]|nr:MAG: THO complex subunit 2 [Trizodia sp. TS-e1964]